MVSYAVLMVRAGQGLDSYRTIWLVEFNWVGFLVSTVCIVLALLVGVGLRWNERRREQREWSELANKQRGGETGA
jgi:hypothetical protein